MTKDSNNKPLETVGDEALEARIVAWVLGEASAFEAAELEQLCGKDPEVALFVRRMRMLDGLIRDKVDERWTLPDEKRAKVLEVIGEEPVVRLPSQGRWRRTLRRSLLPIAAVLVLALVIGGAMSTMGSKGKRLLAPLAEMAPTVVSYSGRSDSGVIDAKVAEVELMDVAEIEARGRGLSVLPDELIEGTPKPLTLPPARPSAGPVPDGQNANIVTGGLRSGDAAVTRDSIDAILNQPAASPEAPRAEQARKREAPERKPSAPSSSVAKEIAAATASEDKIPVPTIDPGQADPFFGADADFGGGWGGAGGSGGGGGLPEVGDIPALGRLFREGPAVSGAASGELAEAPSDSSSWFGLHDTRQSARDADERAEMDPFVSGGGLASKDKEGWKKGGIEGEVHAGYNNTYEFRFADLDSSRGGNPESPGGAENGRFKADLRLGIELGSDFDTDSLSEGRLGLGSRVDDREAKRSGEATGTVDDGFDGFVEYGAPLGEKARREGGESTKHKALGITGLAENVSGGLLTETVNGGLQSDLGTDGSKVVDSLARDENGRKANQNASGRQGPADDSVREELLNQVDAAWSLAVPEDGAPAEKRQNQMGMVAADELDVTAGSAAERKAGDVSEDPVRTNPALTQDHAGKVDEIRRKLHLGEGHYNLGEFDKAKEAYEQALRVDPYNTAARRGMEKIAAAKSDYYKAAYDSTRAELLAEVDSSWKEAVPADAQRLNSAGAAMITNKLEQIQVPQIDFEDTTLEEAIDYLRIRSIELDSSELDPSRKGIGYAIRVPDRSADGGLGSSGGTTGLRIENLKLENASLKEALDHITQATGTKWTVDDDAISILPDQKKEVNHEQTLDLMAEVSAAEEAFSTFSLHVSDASFKLASAALQRGERPDAEGIRPEEFYNAFDYGDPAPSAGEPVACAMEQASHPAFPQRNLLRIAVRAGASGRAQSVPLNVTLLLDNSGSMERADRAEGVARAVDQLSSLLKPGDKVTVAGFSRTPRLLADRMDGAQAAELNDIVRQVPAEGGTNLEQALVLGEELAMRQFVPGAQNRMVLFTDGAANLGDADPESLNTRVETMRQNGIAFDAAGFGADGLNDRLLERLTRNGNGRYYVVDDPAEADEGFAKKLAGAFRPAAENVKVQVVFNPDRVGNYKLIGFEEHRLKKEDFRDDTVDAAEMASEEAGVALYQMEVLPQGRGEIGEVRVRFRDAASGEMVERSWTIPYESDAPAFDQAAESLQLATLAALAAEKLRDAPMAGTVDFSELAPVIGRVAAKYGGSARVEELRRMIEALR